MSRKIAFLPNLFGGRMLASKKVIALVAIGVMSAVGGGLVAQGTLAQLGLTETTARNS